MWRRVGTGAALVVAVVVLSGCETLADWMDNGDSFEDRTEAISAVYRQGKESRQLMEKTGVVVDENSCGSAWVTSGAKDAENDMSYKRDNNEDFQELRRLSFINGCMDRPNKLPPVNAPSLKPTPTPSKA